MAAKKQQTSQEQAPQEQDQHLTELQQQLAESQQQLEAAMEREKRALADYQNLLRRNQQERSKLLKFANQDLIQSLLQPVEHLSLAAHEIDDDGLQMVVADLWKKLKDAGLEEINPQGQPFNLEQMEVVDREEDVDDTADTIVKKVVRRGYKLHDQVIQHAKVIVGKK